MTEEDDAYGPVIDQLIASHFTLQAFMLEVSCDLARIKLNPQEWARGRPSACPRCIRSTAQRAWRSFHNDLQSVSMRVPFFTRDAFKPSAAGSLGD